MNDIVELIRSDLFRVSERTDIWSFLREFIRHEGFNYSVWFRLASAYRSPAASITLRILLRRKQRCLGILVPLGTTVGPGLYIGHYGGIVVHPSAVIGANCNLSQGVTIGANEGPAAVIGNNVYIGPHVCIVENVTIGDNVTIGAGSVVTRDVPSNVTVAGVPARILSDDGGSSRAGRYIKNRWRGTPGPASMSESTSR